MEQEQNSEPYEVELWVKCEDCNEVLGKIRTTEEEALDLWGSRQFATMPCPFQRNGKCFLTKERCNCG